MAFASVQYPSRAALLPSDHQRHDGRKWLLKQIPDHGVIVEFAIQQQTSNTQSSGACGIQDTSQRIQGSI
jgi:hypothetical protein